MTWKESELHHSIGSLIDGAHPSLRTERGVVVSGCLSLVAEHWRLKPDALARVRFPEAPLFFLSFPLPFQKSLDSNGRDNFYQSSDLGEPHLSGSVCCDEAQILSKS